MWSTPTACEHQRGPRCLVAWSMPWPQALAGQLQHRCNARTDEDGKPRYNRLLVRSASNAYFPEVVGAISIPEAEDPLRQHLISHLSFLKRLKTKATCNQPSNSCQTRWRLACVIGTQQRSWLCFSSRGQQGRTTGEAACPKAAGDQGALWPHPGVGIL